MKKNYTKNDNDAAVFEYYPLRFVKNYRNLLLLEMRKRNKMTKKMIRKIFRIVLLLADGAQDNWEGKDWTCLNQGDIGSLKANELKSKTDEGETGKYKKYFFRGQPLLTERETWRFVDVQDDTLGDIYVIVCPHKSSDEERTFVLEQHKFSGGISFTYTEVGNTSRFFWLPSYIPKLLKDSFSFSEQIEEKTYLVFNHVNYICSAIHSEPYEYTSKQLAEIETLYHKKASHRKESKYRPPKILSLSNYNDVLCTGGITQCCKDFFVKSNNEIKTLGITDFFLEFSSETQLVKPQLCSAIPN